MIIGKDKAEFARLQSENEELHADARKAYETRRTLDGQIADLSAELGRYELCATEAVKKKVAKMREEAKGGK